MTKRQMGRRLRLLASATIIVFSGTTKAAENSSRYTINKNGVQLQITALRDDIIRIRAGVGALPEDASWAVNSEIRHRLIPLHVSPSDSSVTLSTDALVITITRENLHILIADNKGRVVLDDAPGAGLVSSAQNNNDVSLSPAAGGIHLRKSMPVEAHYFGLGDKGGPLDRLGEAFTLWNTDAYGFGETTDSLYKSIPFFLGVLESGRSFGVFFDNTWRSYFDFGKTERSILRFGAEGGPLDYYVMAAAEPKRVVQSYAYLTGTAPFVPSWALGFQQSRYSYETEIEARGIANRLRAEHFPADVLYLDIDYQDRDRPFTVSKSAFPDLPKFITDLAAMDFKVVLITDLHIANAPHQNYQPFDSGMAKDVFLKRIDGSIYSANVWPGQSVFPDFSRDGVRDWWGGLYQDFVKAGAAGFWNDMNEPAIFDVRDKTMPLDTVHQIEGAGFASRKASHAEMHNVYGMLNSRATYEGLLRLTPNLRPFVLTRASYAGGQRYAATWTGDNVSTWGHLRMSIAQLNNLGLSGFSLAGDDIGGYAGAGPSADLLTRWIEIGAFNPIFRDHAGKEKPPQEPWVGGSEHAAIRRRYIEERYRLMPYIYALAEENSRLGLPLMRPVFLEFPDQLGKGGGLGGNADQFMLGPNLLIAPATEGESPYPYTIKLPGEGWYDYWLGKKLKTATLVETPQLERLPVFVRPGAILPRQPLVQSTSQKPIGPLQLAIYPGADCSGQLYFDDGLSFAYKNGEYLRQTVTCHIGMNGIVVELSKRDGRYKPWWRQIDLCIYGVAGAPQRVLWGRKILGSHYDVEQQTLRISLPDIDREARVVIEYGRNHS